MVLSFRPVLLDLIAGLPPIENAAGKDKEATASLSEKTVVTSTSGTGSSSASSSSAAETCSVASSANGSSVSGGKTFKALQILAYFIPEVHKHCLRKYVWIVDSGWKKIDYMDMDMKKLKLFVFMEMETVSNFFQIPIQLNIHF
jgi:hypothetical protein